MTRKMTQKMNLKQLIIKAINFGAGDNNRAATPKTPKTPKVPARTERQAKPKSWIKQDDYEDIKELVHGSEAMTSLTKSTTTGRVYVVKRYSSYDFAANNPVIQQCKKPLPNEATIVLKVLRPHPNILRAFGCDRMGPGRCNLYTEFCAGGDLMDKIVEFRNHKRTAPEPLCLHVFISLAQALAYLHHGLHWDPQAKRYWQEPGFAGYIHGDIKPANTFLRWSSEAERIGLPDVVLGDFGMTAPKNHFHLVAGTDGYCAPEIRDIWDLQPDGFRAFVSYAGETGHMTTATDVYSLGQTIHRLGTNRLHVTGADPDTEPVESTDEGMVGVRLGREPLWYKSDALTNAVQWCLSVSADDRPEVTEEELLVDVAILRRELKKLLARKQPTSQQSTGKQLATKQSARRGLV